MYKIVSCFILFSFLFIKCANKNIAANATETKESLGYYSDYFVFLADDKDGPLVVPIDINWSLHSKGFDVEYKSWYGTAEEWPIEYLKKSIHSSIEDIPNEALEHPDLETFHFQKKNRSITVNIKGAPSINMTIPVKEKWTLGIQGSEFPTYAFKTTVQVGNKNRTGWVIYERIRFKNPSEFDGFEAFYWMPVVVDGNLYHFTQHKGEQTAVKWKMENNNVKAETVPNFNFKIVETLSDAKSKRTEIPKIVELQVPSWKLDITLTSTGKQVGYGEEYPKGLAYFRQSLLESTTSTSYGMMELILGNN